MEPKFHVTIIDTEQAYCSAISEVVTQLLPDVLITETDNAAIGSDRNLRARCNLVISDLNRPGNTGEQFLKAKSVLPENEQVKHVLMISGGSDSTKSITKGNVTYLGKPFTAQKLAHYIKSEILGLPPESLDSPKIKIDIEFIKPFIEGTLYIISQTTGINVVKKEVYIRNPLQISGDISALVAMESDKQKGSMAIAFEEHTFLDIASRMLGEYQSKITPEIQDAAAELCNQIYGYARNKLNQKGHEILPAVPQIHIAHQHSVNHLVQGSCLAVRFATDVGTFCIEATMER